MFSSFPALVVLVRMDVSMRILSISLPSQLLSQCPCTSPQFHSLDCFWLWSHHSVAQASSDSSSLVWSSPNLFSWFMSYSMPPVSSTPAVPHSPNTFFSFPPHAFVHPLSFPPSFPIKVWNILLALFQWHFLSTFSSLPLNQSDLSLQLHRELLETKSCRLES